MDSPCSQNIPGDKPILQVKVEFPQLCLTFCDPMGYTVHGFLQARTLECIAFSLSRGSSQPRERTQVSHIAGGFFYHLSHQGSPRILEWVAYPFFSGSSQPRNWTGVSCVAGGFFTNWAIREAPPKSILQPVHKYKEYILSPSVRSEIQSPPSWSPPRELHGEPLCTFSPRSLPDSRALCCVCGRSRVVH